MFIINMLFVQLFSEFERNLFTEKISFISGGAGITLFSKNIQLKKFILQIINA
jgi:hypothetical protein